VVLLVLLPLTPEMYRNYKIRRFAAAQELCFAQQLEYEKGIKEFLKQNPDKLFSPGLIKDAELSKAMLEQKILPANIECPAGGVLRVGSLNLSGDYVVSCSLHGSHDRPANSNENVTLDTHAGGTLVYSAAIDRDQADVLAAYLLSTGFLSNPATRIVAKKEGNKIQIAFKAKVDKEKSQAFKENILFHAREISKQIFSDAAVEFKLTLPDQPASVIISTLQTK
jgi:hypothetical protein